jgi:hypothetical protein
MAYNDAERERVLAFYDAMTRWLRPALTPLSADADAAFQVARGLLAGMLDEIPYADRPEHTMAAAMFSCASMLAVFRVLRENGVDAHAWGRAIHALPPAPEPDIGGERYTADAEASLADAASNEFLDGPRALHVRLRRPYEHRYGQRPAANRHDRPRREPMRFPLQARRRAAASG